MSAKLISKLSKSNSFLSLLFFIFPLQYYILFPALWHWPTLCNMYDFPAISSISVCGFAESQRYPVDRVGVIRATPELCRRKRQRLNFCPGMPVVISLSAKWLIGVWHKKYFQNNMWMKVIILYFTFMLRMKVLNPIGNFFFKTFNKNCFYSSSSD